MRETYLSPRHLGRGFFARLVARVLIAAVLFSLVPLQADASISTSALHDPRPIKDLGPAAKESGCLVMVVVMAADPSSSVAKTAFGELLAHTGTDPQPYAFAGEPYDPNTGFQYHRARWMDPSVGLFTALGPHRGDMEQPATLHGYIHAGADPANRTDPSGLFFESVSFGGLSIMNTIASISLPSLSSLLYAVAAGTGSQNQQALIDQTVTDVVTIFSSDNDCTRFFCGANAIAGENIATAALNGLGPILKSGTTATSDTGISMSPPWTMKAFTSDGINVYRLPTKAVVNRQGPFFQTFNLQGGQPRQHFNIGSFPPNTAQARKLMLLHEIAHLVMHPTTRKYLIPDDGGGNSSQSAQNTRTVEASCRDQVR